MSGPITDADVQVKPDDPPWTCIYCGATWAAVEPVARLQGHVLVCELHPTRRLAEALRPFADYVKDAPYLPEGLAITAGSQLARRQLTAGDCLRAAAVMKELGL